jgi:hypothetical protein
MLIHIEGEKLVSLSQILAIGDPGEFPGIGDTTTMVMPNKASMEVNKHYLDRDLFWIPYLTCPGNAETLAMIGPFDYTREGAVTPSNMTFKPRNTPVPPVWLVLDYVGNLISSMRHQDYHICPRALHRASS